VLILALEEPICAVDPRVRDRVSVAEEVVLRQQDRRLDGDLVLAGLDRGGVRALADLDRNGQLADPP